MRKRERERERESLLSERQPPYTWHAPHHTYGNKHTPAKRYRERERERERERMNISERFRGCEEGPYLHNKYTQTNATIR